MEQKVCRRCKTRKNLDEFQWSRQSVDGHRAVCADCLWPRRTPGPVNRRRVPEEIAKEAELDIRICRVCLIAKSFKHDFYHSIHKHGRHCISSDCKECRRKGDVAKAPIKRIYNAKYHQENREAILLQKRIQSRSRLWQIKMEVLNHYGPICACCGESNPYFLQIDHINGGGMRHRKSLKKHAGFHFYEWIIDQGFPTGFRILCANCNCAYGYYGFCPHQGRGHQLRLL